MKTKARRSRVRTRKSRTVAAHASQQRITSRSVDHPARAVLVATDGSAAAARALRLVATMAARGHWAPEVITVCEPLPVAIGPIVLPELAADQESTMTNAALERIRRHLRRAGAGAWNLRIDYGRAAPGIARAARDTGAKLIVIGLGHHGKLARVLGAETAARVIRHSDVPVLAVHPDAPDRVRRAVVAIDFGDSSILAAREAVSLLEPPAQVHLVHVRWGYNVSSLRDTDWDRAYRLGVEHGFSRLRTELERPSDVELTTEVVDGSVVEALLDVARTSGADLIALGSHSQTVIDRLVIGSTPAEVLRAAACSVLVAPPADAHT